MIGSIVVVVVVVVVPAVVVLCCIQWHIKFVVEKHEPLLCSSSAVCDECFKWNELNVSHPLL